MLVIIFAVAHLAVIPADPEAAEQALAPFAPFNGSGGASDEEAEAYAAACQSIKGTEFNVSDLKEMGILTEDGDPMEGWVVLRAA